MTKPYTVTPYTDIIPTTRDAVFGRGRKRDCVRKGSLYRALIEKHWLVYSRMDAKNFDHRRAFVKREILDVIVRAHGRFIVRDGPRMELLDPEDLTDLKLIFKKVQRALFNEKKRQEAREPDFDINGPFGASAESDAILRSVMADIEEGRVPSSSWSDDSPDDAPSSTSSLSAFVPVQDDDDDEEVESEDEEAEESEAEGSDVEEEDEDSDEEEEEDSEDEVSDEIMTVSFPGSSEEDVPSTEEDTKVSSYQHDSEEDSWDEEIEAMKTVKDAMASVATVTPSTTPEPDRRRSSIKLDSLAALATSLLQKKEQEDQKKLAVVVCTPEDGAVLIKPTAIASMEEGTIIVNQKAAIPAPTPSNQVGSDVKEDSSGLCSDQKPLKKRHFRGGEDLMISFKPDGGSPYFNQSFVYQMGMNKPGAFGNYFATVEAPSWTNSWQSATMEPFGNARLD